LPCPYFEPTAVADSGRPAEFRLPLILEYEGLCHSAGALAPVPAEGRFAYCNHGYSHGKCERFPAGEQRACLRYAIRERAPGLLRIVCIEEQDYAPVQWLELTYAIAADRIEPEIGDACIRAQALAFCRAYLLRFG
jgi:hypothetical protein